MAIALIVGADEEQRKYYAKYITEWKNALLAVDTQLDIRIYPDLGNRQEIDIVLVYFAPLNIFAQFPHAKCIITLTAGVDRIFLADPLPTHIPVARLTDPYMATDICQYVVAYTLHYMKRIDRWAHAQAQHVWDQTPPVTFTHKNIGVMGLGYLGKKTAEAFHYLGLTVSGWSSRAKNIPGVTCYSGKGHFIEFLQQTDILICMLPLTPTTHAILNRETFSHLRKNAYLINVGRGKHLVEEDLLAALEEGQLSGAVLDVFATEPLPLSHPFWHHPQIHITPHIASITNPATAAIQVVHNIHRVLAGKKPANEVDLSKGY